MGGGVMVGRGVCLKSFPGQAVRYSACTGTDPVAACPFSDSGASIKLRQLAWTGAEREQRRIQPAGRWQGTHPGLTKWSRRRGVMERGHVPLYHARTTLSTPNGKSFGGDADHRQYRLIVVTLVP